jgi:hypothetical protein
MDFQMDGLPPEVLQRLLDDMPALAVAPSPLVGVIPVAKVVDASGISVEVLSVEVREAGAFIHWRCRADGAVGFLMPSASVTDDQSSHYRVSTANGGGDDRSWAGEIAITPAPPVDANLSIAFTSFGADPQMKMPGWIAGSPVLGPWTFDVPTRDIRRR